MRTHAHAHTHTGIRDRGWPRRPHATSDLYGQEWRGKPELTRFEGNYFLNVFFLAEHCRLKLEENEEIEFFGEEGRQKMRGLFQRASANK
jgi:hypothetical protein